MKRYCVGLSNHIDCSYEHSHLVDVGKYKFALVSVTKKMLTVRDDIVVETFTTIQKAKEYLNSHYVIRDVALDTAIVAEAELAIIKWNTGTANYGDYFVYKQDSTTHVYKYTNNVESHIEWKVKFENEKRPIITFGRHQ